MARGTAARKEEPERRFTTTRVFDAPRNIVFRAWIDPEWVARWWGPRDFTTPFCRIELRPGGVFHYCMRSPDGRDYWGKGIYQEIVEPEKIAFIDSFSDEAGNTVSPAAYGMDPGWPAETLVTVTLTERDGKTTMTVDTGVSEELAERTGAKQGWNESLDKLAEFLSSM